MTDTTTTITTTASAPNWKPLLPSNFASPKVSHCQFAKDENYLRAVLNDWTVQDTDVPVETTPFVYYETDDNNTPQNTKSPLHGHLIRRHRDSPTKDDTTTTTTTSLVPGILFFHTGAGPQDVFLFYKAYQLIQEFQNNTTTTNNNDDDSNVVIMICDILSDDNGWGWDADRTRYNTVYNALLEHDFAQLQSRSIAAVQALLSQQQQQYSNNNCDVVNPHRLAALGWCLGGKPILELGLASQTTKDFSSSSYTIRAMCTFHGIFHHRKLDTMATTTTTTSITNQQKEKVVKEICIFNGMDDPFVSPNDDLEIAKQQLESIGGYTVTIFPMPHSKHGFTNPAQAFNDNPAFDYQKDAATKSWKETLALLRRRL